MPYVAWRIRVVPDPFEESHRQPRAVFKYWAWSTSFVSCSFCSSGPSCTSSSSTACWTFQVSAGTHSANCAEDQWCRVKLSTFLNCSDKLQQFFVEFSSGAVLAWWWTSRLLPGRPGWSWALCLRNASLESGYMFCQSLWYFFTVFPT